MDETPRFISGMPRAGTTWLGKCLNEHPDAAVYGETSYWGRWYVAPETAEGYSRAQIEQILSRLKRRGTCVQAFSGEGPGCLKHLNKSNIDAAIDRHFADIEAPLPPVRLFGLIGRMVAEEEHASCVIEKTPHHVNWIDRICGAMPSALFLLTMREPYGFMRSYQHQGDRKPKEERRKYLWKNHPMGTALVWRGYVRSINDALRRRPDQTMLVRFDEIVDRPAEVLREVQRFFGLEPVEGLDRRVPPDNTSFPGQRGPELRGEEIFWLNVLARRQMRAAGYEPRRTPFTPLRIGVSIALVPFWFIRQYIHLRRRTGGSWLAYVRNWWRLARPSS